MDHAIARRLKTNEAHLVALHEARKGATDKLADHEKRIAELEAALKPEALAALFTALAQAIKANAGAGTAEVCRDLQALVAVLRTPTTRQATVHLPTGPAMMTVKETRP